MTPLDGPPCHHEYLCAAQVMLPTMNDFDLFSHDFASEECLNWLLQLQTVHIGGMLPNALHLCCCTFCTAGEATSSRLVGRPLRQPHVMTGSS